MKRKNIIIVLVAIWIALFSIDFFRVKSGNEPFFAIRVPMDTKVNHVGLLYVYRQEIKIGVSEPIKISEHVDLGLWFLPGLEVYSTFSNN